VRGVQDGVKVDGIGRGRREEWWGVGCEARGGIGRKGGVKDGWGKGGEGGKRNE